MNYVFSDKITPLKPSAIREIFKVAQDPSVITLAAGNPAGESFPIEKLKELSNEIYETMGIPALQYGMTEGYTPLREKIKSRLSTNFSIGNDYDDVIITSGGQQGLDLACKVFCNEHDTVLCENPSFIGALNAFRAYNVILVGIDMDDEGIDLLKLENTLKTVSNVKILYLIPTFQNPSGKCMSLKRRLDVLELCKKYNVIIVEDNPYGELRFKGEDIPTVKSFDTEGRVIYSGSFSKILSAGMRVGFVCAHKDITSKIVVAKQVNDVHTNMFFQVLVDKFIEKYGLDEHISYLKDLYREKCDLMLSCLDEKMDKRVTYTRPEGGLFIWCTLPKEFDSAEFAKIAVNKKVAVVPGSTFLADENAVSSSFRINYSTPTNENIVKGIDILSQVVSEYLK